MVWWYGSMVVCGMVVWWHGGMAVCGMAVWWYGMVVCRMVVYRMLI